MTTIPDGATTWRDLADQLTDEQVARSEHMAAIPSPFTADQTTAALLRAAREFIADTDGELLSDAEKATLMVRPCGIPRSAFLKGRDDR